MEAFVSRAFMGALGELLYCQITSIMTLYLYAMKLRINKPRITMLYCLPNGHIAGLVERRNPGRFC